MVWQSGNELKYVPTDVQAINGDQFTITVNNSSAVVSLSISDATPPNLSLTPMSNAQNIGLETQIELSSNDPLPTPTVQSSAGACSGQIQVSSDSFSSCLGLVVNSSNTLQTSWVLSLAQALVGNTHYEIKLTGLSNLAGIEQASELVQGFTTAQNQLLINEVTESYFYNFSRWVELYNPTSTTIELSDYQLRSPYFIISSQTNGASQTFSLPSYSIPAGGYVVLKAPSDISLPNANNVFYISDGNRNPYWFESGFIELLKNGSTIDFVPFGFAYSPTTNGEWSGTPVAGFSFSGESYNRSLIRSTGDTNSSTDWELVQWSTPGGANDVSCSIDTDTDGIPDCAEVPGATFAGMPLYEWGARSGQTDIFIELDYMDATNNGAQTGDEGILPNRQALDKVVAAFAEKDIHLHIDVGNLFDQTSGTNPSAYDLGGGEQVPFARYVTLGDATATQASAYDYKASYFSIERLPIFHYALFGNRQSASNASSGLGELEGNDFIVTLGENGFSSFTSNGLTQLVNYQAMTFMHELGHNLGLQHGGSVTTNYIPNYISVMNYLYSFGLPTIGTNEGDRYYYQNFAGNSNCDVGAFAMQNGVFSNTYRIDFSNGSGLDINLNSVDERLGLRRSGSGPVDFNCNGNNQEASVNMGSGTWSDYDDWGNVSLVFNRTWSGANNLILAKPSATDEVGDDRQTVVQEPALPDDFFRKRLQKAP